MLRYQKQAWDFLEKKGSGLVLTGKGLNTLEIVKQLVIKFSSEEKLIFVFGLNENEKYNLINDCIEQSVERIPKDIEKDTGKKERQQSYSTKCVYFHSPGNLSKDFLQDTISPKLIDGIIVYRADRIHTDIALQMCLHYYKSFNDAGFIKAFSEKPYDASDLLNTLDLLCIRNIIIQPRFEETVKKSISEVSMQIISISLYSNSENETDFRFAIDNNFSHTFDILQSFFKAFISEYGSMLGVSTIDALSVPRRSLEKKATSEKKKNVYETILFFRKAFFILLHNDPPSFSKFLEMKKPSPYEQPLWASFPQVTPLYVSASKYAESSIPSPKLQWLVHNLKKFPKDKKVLILAYDSSTVATIANYLAGFTAKEDSKDVEIPDLEVSNNEVPTVDKSVFGVVETPFIMLQEIHAQSSVLEQYQPDYIVFWDISLIALRRLEIYMSCCKKSVEVYLLTYPEANELTIMQKDATFENEIFVKIINQMKYGTSRDFIPLNFKKDMTIIADDREFRSGMPNALLKDGFKVIPSMITVGDYVLTKDIVIERKAYNDLVQSLKSGRLLSQIQRMSQYYKRPMIMLEFSDTDHFNAITARDKSTSVALKLATIIRHFPNLRIIWGRNCIECAKTMEMLREGGDEPVLNEAQEMGTEEKSSNSDESKGSRFLSAIPFLLPEHISKIRERCKNVKQLLKVPRDELMELLGYQIGLKLYIFLHSKQKQEYSQ